MPSVTILGNDTSFLMAENKIQVQSLSLTRVSSLCAPYFSIRIEAIDKEESRIQSEVLSNGLSTHNEVAH